MHFHRKEEYEKLVFFKQVDEGLSKTKAIVSSDQNSSFWRPPALSGKAGTPQKPFSWQIELFWWNFWQCTETIVQTKARIQAKTLVQAKTKPPNKEANTFETNDYNSSNSNSSTFLLHSKRLVWATLGRPLASCNHEKTEYINKTSEKHLLSMAAPTSKLWLWCSLGWLNHPVASS